jgi:hypothetical protein
MAPVSQAVCRKRVQACLLYFYLMANGAACWLLSFLKCAVVKRAFECHGSCGFHFRFEDGLDYGVKFIGNRILAKFVLLEADKVKCSTVLLLPQRVWAVQAAGHGCHIVEHIRQVERSL